MSLLLYTVQFCQDSGESNFQLASPSLSIIDNTTKFPSSAPGNYLSFGHCCSAGAAPPDRIFANIYRLLRWLKTPAPGSWSL